MYIHISLKHSTKRASKIDAIACYSSLPFHRIRLNPASLLRSPACRSGAPSGPRWRPDMARDADQTGGPRVREVMRKEVETPVDNDT